MIKYDTSFIFHFVTFELLHARLRERERKKKHEFLKSQFFDALKNRETCNNLAVRHEKRIFFLILSIINPMIHNENNENSLQKFTLKLNVMSILLIK